jgi:phospholipid/cholesterol/gamma-HCH transport system permease protein
MALLAADGIRQAFRRPFERALWLEQLDHLGVQSITITNVTLLFTGMVLAVQTSYSLASYGGQSFVGNLLGLAIVRELGPVLTALMVAGRVGAGITAELGAMQVSEQIDAIRSMGADPVRKLVLPRLLAGAILLPILTAGADVLGIASSMLMARIQAGVSFGRSYQTVARSVTAADVLGGLGKTVFFGAVITLIACHQGLNATGGTEGVGRATTRAVVLCSVATLVGEFVLTKILLLFGV